MSLLILDQAQMLAYGDETERLAVTLGVAGSIITGVVIPPLEYFEYIASNTGRASLDRIIEDYTPAGPVDTDVIYIKDGEVLQGSHRKKLGYIEVLVRDINWVCQGIVEG